MIVSKEDTIQKTTLYPVILQKHHANMIGIMRIHTYGNTHTARAVPNGIHVHNRLN